MNDRLYGTIETQITENNEISTVLYGNNQQVTTYTSEVPQIQTIIQAGYMPAVSILNAPFVEVTSVNGMTGDVITEPIVKGFEPNHYYLKDTIISRSGKLYCANETFTSGEYFDGDDWTDVSGSGGITNITSNDNTVTVVLGTESADLSIADTLENYVLKEAGKGLSSNDYTTSEKTKLDGIESGAQKNLPNTVIDASYVHTDNNFTTTLKNKLDGIESGAQKNVQANWTQTTTTAGDYIKNKPTLGNVAALNKISKSYIDYPTLKPFWTSFINNTPQPDTTTTVTTKLGRTLHISYTNLGTAMMVTSGASTINHMKTQFAVKFKSSKNVQLGIHNCDNNAISCVRQGGVFSSSDTASSLGAFSYNKDGSDTVDGSTVYYGNACFTSARSTTYGMCQYEAHRIDTLNWIIHVNFFLYPDTTAVEFSILCSTISANRIPAIYFRGTGSTTSDVAYLYSELSILEE